MGFSIGDKIMAIPETRANALFNTLTSDVDVSLPEINFDSPLYKLPGGENNDLYKEIKQLTNADLTTKEIDGSGTFDTIMSSVKKHLREEYETGRITGSEYTKAYIALTEAALGNAVQFLVQRDAAYWNSIGAQVGAITGLVGLESAKVNYAALLLEANRTKAEYAISKMGLATSDAEYKIQDFNLTNLLPKQRDMLVSQIEGQDTQNIGLSIDNDTKSFQLTTLLPSQNTLLKEQTEAQRAQTLDVRGDGSSVNGLIGKQKELYAQQVTSYQRDAEVKAAKMYADAWVVQKTIDEGLTPPNSFSNPTVDSVMAAIRTKNGL